MNHCPATIPAEPPPKEIQDRSELHITNLECQQVDDVAKWYAGVKKWKPVGSDVGPCCGRSAASR